MAHTPYPRSDRDLLSRISRSAGHRAGYKQLIRELGLGGGRERRLLLEQLTRMVARGELVRAGDDAWSIPGSDPKPRDVSPSDQRTPRFQPFKGMEASLKSSRDRLISGRLDLHRDGFGFVRPDSPSAGRDGDIFIPPNEINGAMQGDLVLVDEAPPARDGRRSGRIARILTRRNPTVVGIFHYARPHGRRTSDQAPTAPTGNYVTPLDERISGAISIPPGDEAVPLAADTPHRMLGDEARHTQRDWQPANPDFPLEGLAVDVEITAFPTPGRPARGRILEVLGPPDAFGVDVEIIIRKHHIPHTFPAPVLAEASDRSQETVATLSIEDLAAREDFRGLPIVTIDGETARDFDDAVLVRPLPNGNTELQVHIADVSWYVRPGSALDTEARVRGNSVYFPDRAVPMLPHALSSGMCSLLPKEDRLVLSCIMEVDPRGEIITYRVTEGIIRSARRMTYTSVQHCINASPNASHWNQHTKITSEPTAEDLAERERIALEQPELIGAFDAMLELALRLNAKRVRRGSIDFDLPEPIVQFDPDGNMQAIIRSERGWSHRLIEEFMLSANECVAHWLEALAIPSLYRIHEMPDPKRIVDFEETAATFGHSLGLGNLPVRKLTMKSDRRDSRQRSTRGRDSRAPQQHEIPESIPVTPQLYQKLVRRISGTAEERILAYLMLRSLKQARYAEQNEGHFALASPSYTHFTSPIRRYPDLIVHRLTREMLRRGANPHGVPILSTDPQPWQTEFDRKRGKHAASGNSSTTHDVLSRPKRSAVERPASSSQATLPEPISAEELNDIAAETSQTERRAADAERELIEWKKIKFMQDKVGEDFPAVILSCTKYGFFVELNELFIEGLVPLTSLTGDHYTFRDTDRTIVGSRTGHVFSLGQRVEVILDRIDRQQRRLQFALLPGTEPVANTGAPGKPKTASKKDRAKAKVKEKKLTGKAKTRQRKNR
ncbi:RNB domain-containing ribonuclease [Granulicella sp. 5B5]|uniref:ribonuclease R family protein n=1 Tax=Granulicella sp. 5B5 TaxID=1617967 RepID=UPI0015F71614|nr:RNB domain-containing ribonuclease [Granulicella sp. 5B5]QMV19356.1 RNB domain-containing ribonuclease [Granulicella sp. 5B5]